MTPRGRRTTVIFDGDDTLWNTQELYAAATAQVYQRLEGLGFKAERIRSLFRSFNRPRFDDVLSGRERRNRAIADAYATLCRESGRVPDPQLTEELVAANEKVYHATPEPLEDAHAVLSALSDRTTLVFFSGGEDEVQRTKLARASLSDYFDGRVYVVPRKDRTALRHVLRREKAQASETWMVGNSPRFDINPALELDLKCIWLHTGFWREDIEEFKPCPMFVAFGLREVLGILSHGRPFSEGAYVPPEKEFAEICLWLKGNDVSSDEALLVGSSLKHDINPGLDLGLSCIWLYTVPRGGEREPSLGKIYAAFSRDRVDEILPVQSNRTSADQVLWRTRDDNDGRGPEVND
jgi:putative hydrolase of the HAD superfamily